LRFKVLYASCRVVDSPENEPDLLRIGENKHEKQTILAISV